MKTLKNESKQAGQDRRAFLKGMAAGGATVVVVATAGATNAATAQRPVEDEPRSQGYRLTAHINRYYETARF